VIKSYAVDKVNNKSNSQTANEKTSIPYIDLTGPELSYSLKGPKFSTRDTLFISSETQITLKAVDTEAGVHRISYSVSGSDPQEFTEAFNIEKEGYSSVEYTGYDNVENTSGGALSVKVDNTGPVVSASFGTSSLRNEGGVEVYPSHTVLFLSATDNVVGFQKMSYSLNGSSEKSCSGMLRDLPVGKHEMHIKATDKLGNSTEKSIRFIIE
jgi:hypothetical protein